MTRIADTVEAKWNIDITLIERGKRRLWHHRSHNIVVNTGRQFLCEIMTPATLGPGTFTRTQNTVMRYTGFGIGGARQNSAVALAAPYTDASPGGYPGANTAVDDDPTVAILQRPVRVSAAPLYMQQISTPGTFDTATRTTFISVFAEADISYGAYASVPLSEIGLYSSLADPTLPNGGGAYPGTGAGALFAYDTFATIHKTNIFSIQVEWEIRF